MSLLDIMFLLLVNILVGVSSISPNVEGVSAISAWLLVCILFVFGALLEYAVVLYKMKKYQKKKIHNSPKKVKMKFV
jgi:hypothetical protein